jgi:dipeptidyl aminopeptidase/acylaminoacyl peptidase
MLGMADDVRKRVRQGIGVHASQVSPEKAAAKIRVPVLIVHGTKDAPIPVAQGRAVFDAITDARKNSSSCRRPDTTT